VQKIFPIFRAESKMDQIQSRLMVLVAFFLVSYALVLSLAPTIRITSNSVNYQINHWIGVAVWFVSFSLLHYLTVRKLPDRDPFLLPLVSLLTGLGLMMIWRLYPNLGMRQALWIGISSLIGILCLKTSPLLGYLRKYKYSWLILGLLLTAITVFFGSNPAGDGPALWLNIFNIHFQPSEFLKLILIIYLAGFFADRVTFAEGKLATLLPNLLVTGAAIILLIVQKDLGTASIFLLIYLAMLFTTRGRSIILWISPILILAAGVIGYFFIYVVRLRIDTWLAPFSDPTGTSYQIIQSMMAIAEGKLFGTGPGLGSPNLVPVAVSDFVFSALAEELGFLGVTVLILSFIFLIYRGQKIALKSQNAFQRYLALGLVFYFGIQSILIIGGNIGMLPLTGVTLPFISYGGSSMLVSSTAVWLLLIISQKSGEAEENRALQSPRLVIVSSVLIAILIIEILITSLISFWFSPRLVDRIENPRWTIADRYSPRGSILDRNNQSIIYTSGEPGAYSRESHHIPLYPILGYTSATYGQTGIEASMYPYLRGLRGYNAQTIFWKNLLYNQPLDGLNVRLTLDLNLQQTADNLLDNASNHDTPGTAILMNAVTGEILAMASHPYFDAANLDTEWDSLLQDENAPLLNRATQGLYPPGEALASFTATLQTEYIEENLQVETTLPDLVDQPECAQFLDEPLTWPAVITNGCQGVQSALSQLSQTESILTLYQNLAFFAEPKLYLEVADVSSPEFSGDLTTPLEDIAFMVSPLQMSMAASALTNQGILPGPRLVNAYQDPDGSWVTIPKQMPNSQALPPGAANQIGALLSEISSLPVWQVTAVTKTDDDQPVTWFIAGTSPESETQPTTVVVLLEAEAPVSAKTIGMSLLEQALSFSSLQD